MMMMMMMMCWWDELRCCSYSFSVWALLKTPEAGRRWDYLRSIFPSHWSLSRSGGDALRWHSQVSGDKKKDDEPRRRNTSVGGRTASFHLMVDAPLRVLTRLEVSVQLLRYWLNTLLSFWDFNLNWAHFRFLCVSVLNKKVMKGGLGASAPLRTAHRSTRSEGQG